MSRQPVMVAVIQTSSLAAVQPFLRVLCICKELRAATIGNMKSSQDFYRGLGTGGVDIVQEKVHAHRAQGRSRCPGVAFTHSSKSFREVNRYPAKPPLRKL